MVDQVRALARIDQLLGEAFGSRVLRGAPQRGHGGGGDPGGREAPDESPSIDTERAVG